ncbi:hypothetical protein IAI18_21970 [Acetobacteraceae bacterium H6797]|nr:hypothetical protein [Acetobacteraceae bacterium H6797]
MMMYEDEWSIAHNPITDTVGGWLTDTFTPVETPGYTAETTYPDGSQVIIGPITTEDGEPVLGGGEPVDYSGGGYGGGGGFSFVGGGSFSSGGGTVTVGEPIHVETNAE